jgi:Ca-activated chloride channel family protein
MIGNPSFAEPLSLLLCVVLIPLVWLWRIERCRRQNSDAAYGGGSKLRHGRSNWRTRLRIAAVAIGVVLIVVATALPRWGSAALPVERRGIDIAIVLDVSRSMTATDVLPSRARAAAAGLQTLLTHVRDDRVGLVIFAGEAFERSPLTLDMNALAQIVAQAQEAAPLVDRGTDLGSGIDAALELLAIDKAADTQVIIVVSDGEDLGDRALSTAERAAEKGIAIFTVAAGTDAGAVIPGDDHATSPSRADRITLQAIAARTGGEFRELNAMAGFAIAFQRLHQSAFDEATELQAVERFQWFLAPAIVFLLLHFIIAEAGRLRPLVRSRRGIGVVTSIMLVVGCGGSQLYQHIEVGNEAYEDQRYEDALIEYREARLVEPDEPIVGYNLGNTLHQLRRFEEAAVLSAEALQATEDTVLAQSLRYALGGHAVERGLLFEARARYIDVLRTDPQDQDAKANLELVLSMIDPVAMPTPADDEPNSGSEFGSSGRDRIGDGGVDGQPPINSDLGEDGNQDVDDPSAQDSGNASGLDSPADQGGESGDPKDDAGASGQGSETNFELPIAEAQTILTQALADAGDELTLEQALLLLELSSELSALQSLKPGGAAAGRATDR